VIGQPDNSSAMNVILTDMLLFTHALWMVRGYRCSFRLSVYLYVSVFSSHDLKRSETIVTELDAHGDLEACDLEFKRSKFKVMLLENGWTFLSVCLVIRML